MRNDQVGAQTNTGGVAGLGIGPATPDACAPQQGVEQLCKKEHECE